MNLGYQSNTLSTLLQHPRILERDIEILELDGSDVFTQKRRVPHGSNWPSNIEGNPGGPPRPAVIGIRRKQSSGRFV